MGNFTDYEENWIEMIISSHMEIICKEILKKIKDAESIILVGGFGRGEGSIKIIENEKLVPFKDYDLIVISNHSISEKEYIFLIKSIHVALNIPSSWYQGAAPGEFHINIKFVTRKSLTRLPPDISNYEIKKGSRILYGKDLRELIPINKEDINYSSGLRVLLNKIIGLLENYPLNQKFFDENSKLKESCIYECGKTYLEIATAMTILMGCYEPTYKARARNFGKFFGKKMPDLSKKLPNLSERVQNFTKFKLRPFYDEITLDPIELWTSTTTDLLKIVTYYFERYSKQKVKNPLKFLKKFQKFLELNYYFPFLKHYLKNHFWYNSFFTYLGSLFIHFYENFRFLKSLIRDEHYFPLPGFMSKQSPILKIYCTSLSILLAFQYPEYKGKLVEFAEKLIKQVYPFKIKEETVEVKWDEIRKKCIEAHKFYEFTKYKKSTF